MDALGFEGGEPLFHGGIEHPLFDGAEDACDLAVYGRQLTDEIGLALARLDGQAIHLFLIGLRECYEEVRGKG